MTAALTFLALLTISALVLACLAYVAARVLYRFGVRWKDISDDK